MAIGRREFLVRGGAAAGLALAAPAVLAGCVPLRTNVLVITADDMRWDLLRYLRKTPGCFADGTTFTSCRLNASSCQASRVGFLSGQWARRTGCYGTATYLPDPSASLGPWMRSAGYRTAMIGKYPYPYGGTPLEGWDLQRTFTGATEQLAYDYVVFNGTGTEQPSGYQADYVFDQAVSFVEANRLQPWFCWVTPSNPHVPLVPRPQDIGDWADVVWPIEDDPDPSKPSWIQALPPLAEEQRAYVRSEIVQQLEELDAVDDGVAAVFDALRTTRQLGRTVVVFTSDNGVLYGEHRLGAWGPSLKDVLYEPSARVPLLARGPGFAAGTVTAPTTVQDLTATVLAIAGAHPTVPLDGMDLRGTVPASRTLLHERSGSVPSPLPGLPGGVGVSTTTRKLWRHEAADPDRYEMYLLDSDPDELHNVAYDPDLRAERDGLEATLDALLAV